MKKSIIAILALILALAALILTVFACLEIKAQTARLDALETQLQQLQSQMAETQPPVTDPPVADPTNPPAPEDEGECYCNLYLGDWTCEDGTLTLTAASAQVVSTPGRQLTGAALILEVNGTSHSTVVLQMHPGEASDSYELDLSGFSLNLPELSQGDQMNLYLEATLSDGSVLTALGGTWDYEGDQLLMVAG